MNDQTPVRADNHPPQDYTRPHICIFCHYPILHANEVRIPAVRKRKTSRCSYKMFAHRTCLPIAWQEAAHA